jgi:hypothetical protein
MPWRSRTSVARGSPALQVLVGPPRRPKPRIKLVAQAGELTVPVTARHTALPPCELETAEMTSRLTTVSFHCLLVGLARRVDFDDHNKLLGVTIRNRCRSAPAWVISGIVASMSPGDRLRP